MPADVGSEEPAIVVKFPDVSDEAIAVVEAATDEEVLDEYSELICAY